MQTGKITTKNSILKMSTDLKRFIAKPSSFTLKFKKKKLFGRKLKTEKKELPWYYEEGYFQYRVFSNKYRWTKKSSKPSISYGFRLSDFRPSNTFVIDKHLLSCFLGEICKFLIYIYNYYVVYSYEFFFKFLVCNQSIVYEYKPTTLKCQNLIRVFLSTTHFFAFFDFFFFLRDIKRCKMFEV